MDKKTTNNALIEKFHAQTAKLTWSELVPHFAKNIVWSVDPGLDLIEVACLMADDGAIEIKRLIDAGLFKKLDVALAKEWAETSDELWTVVVAPWVLVQARSVG